MNVTDGDRERAVRLLVAIPRSSDRVALVAAAFADERERVLAPLLALADEMRTASFWAWPGWSHRGALADRIRRAAEPAE